MQRVAHPSDRIISPSREWGWESTNPNRHESDLNQRQKPKARFQGRFGPASWVPGVMSAIRRLPSGKHLPRIGKTE